MMKLSNKMSKIEIEDVSANMALSCIYLIKNLHNGAEYIISCLKKNGISFKVEIVRDAVTL